MPIDVAKTRIQTAAGGGARAGIARTLRALYREGARAAGAGRPPRSHDPARGQAALPSPQAPPPASQPPAPTQIPNIQTHTHPHAFAGGAGKLYAGMSPALARAFPANAAQWLVFEWSCRALERWAAAGAGGMPRHTAEAQAAAH